jgi:cyclophilin family peptidyl-prolyl cis-trans isomerase
MKSMIVNSLRRAAAALSLAALAAGCGNGGGGTNYEAVAVLSSSAGVATFGDSVLITLNGRNLNQVPLNYGFSATGCNNLTRSTTAPNVSNDTTAYFTCVPAVSSTIHFRATRSTDGVLLADVPFTAIDLPTVASAEASSPARFGESVLITVTGTRLNPARLTLPARATGCSNLTRSTTAPNISTDTVAYFTCSPAVSTTIRFQIQLETSGPLLADVPFTVIVPTVASTELSSPVFIGEPLLITLHGTELQQPLNVTSTGCGAIRKSTIEPHVSTATTAYYRCVPTTAGATAIVVKRVQDDVEVTSIPIAVPAEVPPAEVTLTVDNGAGLSGDIVITLEPAKAPITVGNFLEYVKDGFYKDVVFHRFVPDFVLQGGGYTKTLDPASTTAPTAKPNYGGITLEDDKGLLNLKNTISMARTSAPNTANSQFFFNLKDNPTLNRASDTLRGYAVFGSITAGTELLTAVAGLPSTTPPRCVAWPTLFGSPGDGTCLPSPNLVITNAVRTR